MAETPRVPLRRRLFLALSAHGRAQDRTRSLTAGYSMHVPKPVAG